MKKKNLKILFIARDDGGCGFYRCLQPAHYIKRMGLADTEVVLQKCEPEKILNSDLVVMQNMGSVEASAIAQFCIKSGVPYLAEIDDFLHHVSPNNAAGYQAWNPSTLFLHRAIELIRHSFAMTVSTNQLAREYFPYHPTIFVVPNYLDKEKWDNPMVKRNDGKIRIGWAGGNAHADDLKMISKVIAKIVKERKGKVVFETMGMTKNELRGVFPMPSTDETCPSCGFEGELHHFPGEAIKDYAMILASKGWDIAVAPVIDNGFGNCKSDIKIKEYSAAGIAIVASPVVPYREAVDNGADILFARTFDEWYNNLTKLIDDEALRNEMVKKNREWVSKMWIQDNAQKAFEVYNAIIEQAQQVLGTKEQRLKKIHDHTASSS